MWSAQQDAFENGRLLRFRLLENAAPMSYSAVIHAWQTSHEFRSYFNMLLATVPFTAFRWETPGVVTENVTQPFEFVVYDSPGLPIHPNTTAFAEHFDNSDSSVVVFPNVRGDSILIVPAPRSLPSIYCHIGAFVRRAPEAQRHTLWQTVGETLSQRISDKPVWLSTAGAGVAWLHVRLDDRPKYYGHRPYQQLP